MPTSSIRPCRSGRPPVSTPQRPSQPLPTRSLILLNRFAPGRSACYIRSEAVPASATTGQGKGCAMGAISRRSFVSGAVSGAGAALGAGALAGLAGAGALGMAAGRAASADEPPEGAGPVELDATVAVGGASFQCPTWWPVSADAPDDDSVRLDVVDREGGTACGRVTFTVGSPVEGARNTMIPDVIFDGFARSESMATSNCLSAVWGLERLDQEGDAVPMARALCARN